MKSFAAILALAGAVAAVPAATTTASNPDKTPTASAPAGCSTNYDGTFEISVVNASTVAKRSLHRRTALVATLKDGILTDAEGRTGEIVANSQFQFDPVIQAGAIYTAGWSICENGTLALGGSAVFYECLSGTFYNLYDASTGAQCTPIFIDIVGTGSSVSQASDGQATAASQISDGQIQATTATAVVSQITDGQIQATTGVQVISQISDGQIQATTATAAVVSQISDGQIQATTATSAVVVSQISDGQIQATTATAAVVSQISDGQIQATSAGTISATGARNATTPTVAAISATVSAYTGAAAQATAGLFGLAAGAVALAFL